MARLAVVGAMQQELQALLQLMPHALLQRRAGRDFWSGKLHGHEVVAALSRIGKVAAATTATVLIEHFEVDRMVFTGVAGGLGDGVAVGDMVIARQLLQHDLDASPIFPRYEVPLYGLSRFSTDAALSEALRNAAVAVAANAASLLDADAAGDLPGQMRPAPRVHEGLIVSGDRFVSSRSEAAALRQALPEALAVEMEGAAMAQVCHDYDVALAVLRIISDRADDDAHLDFPRFIERVASRYSTVVVGRLLQSLPR